MLLRKVQKYRVMKQISMDLWGLFKRLKYNIRPGQHGRRRKFYEERRIYVSSGNSVITHSYDFISTIRRLKKFYINVTDRQMRKIRSNLKYLDVFSNTIGAKSFAVLWERRLDMIVYRLGWAQTPVEARHIINHGMIYVNGYQIRKHSLLLNMGDLITLDKLYQLRISSRLNSKFGASIVHLGVPSYLEVDYVTGSAILCSTIEPKDVVYPTKI